MQAIEMQEQEQEQKQEQEQRQEQETFWGLIRKLQEFWGKEGCRVVEPSKLPMGAGSFHPKMLDLLKYPHLEHGYAFWQRCLRPHDAEVDSQYRLGQYYQFQVILKPENLATPNGEPIFALELMQKSLQYIGFDIGGTGTQVRYLQDDWKSKTLVAYGKGWEVHINGMEVAQITYFQKFCGQEVKGSIPIEFTYGTERLLMALNKHDDYKKILLYEWGQKAGPQSDSSEINCCPKEYYPEDYYPEDRSYEHMQPADASEHAYQQWRKQNAGLLSDLDSRMVHLENLVASMLFCAYDVFLLLNHDFNVLNARGIFCDSMQTELITRIANIASRMGAEVSKQAKSTASSLHIEKCTNKPLGGTENGTNKPLSGTENVQIQQDASNYNYGLLTRRAAAKAADFDASPQDMSCLICIVTEVLSQTLFEDVKAAMEKSVRHTLLGDKTLKDVVENQITVKLVNINTKDGSESYVFCFFKWGGTRSNYVDSDHIKKVLVPVISKILHKAESFLKDKMYYNRIFPKWLGLKDGERIKARWLAPGEDPWKGPVQKFGILGGNVVRCTWCRPVKRLYIEAILECMKIEYLQWNGVICKDLEWSGIKHVVDVYTMEDIWLAEKLGINIKNLEYYKKHLDYQEAIAAYINEMQVNLKIDCIAHMDRMDRMDRTISSVMSRLKDVREHSRGNCLAQRVSLMTKMVELTVCDGDDPLEISSYLTVIYKVGIKIIQREQWSEHDNIQHAFALLTGLDITRMGRKCPILCDVNALSEMGAIGAWIGYKVFSHDGVSHDGVAGLGMFAYDVYPLYLALHKVMAFYKIGEHPTGRGDLYGLRGSMRHIVLHSRFSLCKLFECAQEVYSMPEQAMEKVWQDLANTIKVLFEEEAQKFAKTTNLPKIYKGWERQVGGVLLSFYANPANVEYNCSWQSMSEYMSRMASIFNTSNDLAACQERIQNILYASCVGGCAVLTIGHLRAPVKEAFKGYIEQKKLGDSSPLDALMSHHQDVEEDSSPADALKNYPQRDCMEEAERALFQIVEEEKDKKDTVELAKVLQERLEAFCKNVHILADNQKLRQNRLLILMHLDVYIRRAFGQVYYAAHRSNLKQLRKAGMVFPFIWLASSG